MDLKNKCFHSVHSYKYDNYDEIVRQEQLKDILYKFELIFKSGYILPYRYIKRLYGDVSRNKYKRLNRNNMISISLHMDKPEEIDLKYKKECNNDVEDAFESFVFQEPSIVLNENIMNELRHIKYPGIYLERLFLEPISLKYMDGISIRSGMLRPFFEHVDEKEYEKYAKQCDLIRGVDLDFLDKLRDLLIKYKYDVPIVNLLTGNEYKDNDEYRKILKIR